MPKWYLVQAFEIQVEGGGSPPGIWGPTDPRPQPPINLPPGYPGQPPGIWGPTDPRPGWGLPDGGQGGGSPPGIWGPNDPRPSPPIYLPPVQPGEPPLVIWGPGDPRPQPPIHLPPAPPDVNEDGVKPPPEDGGWGYHPEYGWGYFPPQSDKPQPGDPGQTPPPSPQKR